MFHINTESPRARGFASRFVATAAPADTAAGAKPTSFKTPMGTARMPTHIEDVDAEGNKTVRPLTGDEIEKAKAIINSARKSTSQNDQIIKFNEQIENITSFLKMVQKDVRMLQPRLAVVIDANKALKELVVSRNQKAIDVMSVYSDFGFDPANGADAVTMHDFKAFTRKLGYSLICKDQTKFHILLGTVLKGIREARYLKDVCDFKNVVQVARKVGELNDDIKTYTEKLNKANEEHAKLTQHLQPGKTVTVSPDSYVDSFRQQLTLSRKEVTKLRSRIEQAQQALVTLRGLGNKSTNDAKLLVSGVSKQIEIAGRERSGILARLKTLGTNIRKLVSEKSTLQSKFSAKTAAKREAKLRELTDAYKGKRNGQERIDEEIKEWDRIQALQLKARLRNVDAKHADRIRNDDNGAAAASVLKAQEKEVADLQAQLVVVTDNIAVLSENLKKAKIGAALDPLARENRINELQQQLSVDRAALKSADKRETRRQNTLNNELSEDVWEARVNTLLTQPRAAAQAVATLPNTFLYNTILSGANDRAAQQSRLRWRAFKKSKGRREYQFKHNEFANVHFGPTGFVPVPQYRKFSSEINQIIVYGLGAAFKDQDSDDAKSFLLAGVMLLVRPGLESETQLRKLFDGEVKRLKMWLASPKAMPITEEIVEMLMESGKMPLPPGKSKVTGAIVTATAKNLLKLIIESDAVGKLTGMAFQAFRNYITMWMRTAMKLTKTTTSNGPAAGIGGAPAPKLNMAYPDKVKRGGKKAVTPKQVKAPKPAPLKPAPIGKTAKPVKPAFAAPKPAKVAPQKPVKPAPVSLPKTKIKVEIPQQKQQKTVKVAPKKPTPTSNKNKWK